MMMMMMIIILFTNEYHLIIITIIVKSVNYLLLSQSKVFDTPEFLSFLNCVQVWITQQTNYRQFLYAACHHSTLLTQLGPDSRDWRWYNLSTQESGWQSIGLAQSSMHVHGPPLVTLLVFCALLCLIIFLFWWHLTSFRLTHRMPLIIEWCYINLP